MFLLLNPTSWFHGQLSGDERRNKDTWNGCLHLMLSIFWRKNNNQGLNYSLNSGFSGPVGGVDGSTFPHAPNVNMKTFFFSFCNVYFVSCQCSWLVYPYYLSILQVQVQGMSLLNSAYGILMVSNQDGFCSGMESAFGWCSWVNWAARYPTAMLLFSVLLIFLLSLQAQDSLSNLWWGNIPLHNVTIKGTAVECGAIRVPAHTCHLVCVSLFLQWHHSCSVNTDA